jgi:hypothetical protein
MALSIGMQEAILQIIPNKLRAEMTMAADLGRRSASIRLVRIILFSIKGRPLLLDMIDCRWRAHRRRFPPLGPPPPKNDLRCQSIFAAASDELDAVGYICSPDSIETSSKE